LRSLLRFLAGDWLLVWILFLSPALLFSYKLPPSLRIAATAAVLIPAMGKGWVSPAWPTRLLLLPLILSSLSSIYATAFPEITFEKLILLAMSVAVYVAVCARDRNIGNLLAWTLLLLGAVAALALAGPFVTDFAAKNRIFTFSWTFSPFRFREILDANLVGSLVAMTLPLLLGLSLRSRIFAKTRFRRALLWAGFAIQIGALVLMESRAAYVAAAASMALMALLLRPRLWKVYVAAALIGTALLALTGLPRLDLLLGGGAVPTWESRKEVWDRALYMMQDFPFTGIGAGTFVKVLPVLYPLFLTADDVFHSHNLFLQVGVDFGFPGIVAFTALLAASAILAFRSFRRFRAEENTLALTLVLGYSCGLAGMVVHGLLDAPLWLTKPHAVPFFFMGMLVALHRIAAGGDNVGGWSHALASLGFWLLMTLLAISFVGNHPLWALALAIAGGVFTGWHEVSPKA
jgi:putative inorganic carbon (HCO3(-)) transporter